MDEFGFAFRETMILIPGSIFNNFIIALLLFMTTGGQVNLVQCAL